MMITIFFLILSSFGCNCIEDYYWREYLGVIPEDAFVPGQDIAGRNIYVAQAYIKDDGLIPAQITSGTRDVTAAVNGPKKTNKYTKILCGPPENFFWMRSNASTLQLDLDGKRPVIGGHEDSYGVVHIGRISYGGETKVGKIKSYFAGSSSFYYIENGEEKLLNSYEVLMSK